MRPSPRGAAHLAMVLVAALAGCGGSSAAPAKQGPTDATTRGTMTPWTPGPTEPAPGIDVEVRPTAVGDSLRYGVEVRNTTDRPVRVLQLDTGLRQEPEWEGGVVTIVHRHGPGRGGDEAPPNFEALVVVPGQSVAMESNGAVRVGKAPGSVRVCIEVEDLPGGSTSAKNGADTRIVVTDPLRPVRLACSEPTPASRPG